MNGSAGVALYAPVSSCDRRDDLDRQVGRLAAWATQRAAERGQLAGAPE
jgi:putative resolvase